MRLMTQIKSVCVYCGSSTGHDKAFMAAGRELGAAIAKADMSLVYGGGTRGIMGAVAAGCRENGGKVTGIIPRFLMNREASEDELVDLDELIVTEDMHQRKHKMFERSDAFVALPGGIGTVEEIVEIMTWAQLGRHDKPMIFASINGFWDPMMALLDHMREEGFIHSANRVRPKVVQSVEEIVSYLSETPQRQDGEEAVIERM